MKKGTKQGNGLLNGKGGIPEIMCGKGKEYSEVSREVESTFRMWLSHAGMDEAEFDRRMSMKPHRVEECINEDGNIEVNIFAGFAKVIEPLIFQTNAGGTLDKLDDFLVDALFLFSYIASRYEDKSFEKAVSAFADRMVAERKMTL